MAAPSNATYVALINSNAGSPPPGWKTLLSTDSSSQASRYIQDGMQATAYQNIQTGQVIVTFQGVGTIGAQSAASGSGSSSGNGSSPYAAGAAQTDSRILAGDVSVTAKMQGDVTQFLSEVAATAGANTSASNTYLAGYSIGGAYAQAGALAGNYSGISIGGPGLPGYTPSGAAASNFTSYADAGDGIGNYSSDGNASALLPGCMQSSMYH